MSPEVAPNLLPCPFCDGEAAFGTIRYSSKTIREQNWGQDTFHKVNCILCGSTNLGLVGFRTQGEAAEHWNRRAGQVDARQPPVVAAAREALRVLDILIALNPIKYTQESCTSAADGSLVSFNPLAAHNALRAALQTPTKESQPRKLTERPLGGHLAMRVLQSDLYPHLDDSERAECDALIHDFQQWMREGQSIAAPDEPMARLTDNQRKALRSAYDYAKANDDFDELECEVESIKFAGFRMGARSVASPPTPPSEP